MGETKKTTGRVYRTRTEAEEACFDGYYVQAVTNANDGLRQYASVIGYRVEEIVDVFCGFGD